MPLSIQSPSNPRIKQAAALRDRHGRERQGRIIIDGARELRLAIESGVRVHEAYVDEDHPDRARTVALLDEHGIEPIWVSKRVAEKLAYGDRVEAVVAVAQTPRRTLADLRLPAEPLVAVLESVEKPGNLGAIARSADASGVSAIVVADPATDVYNPNAIRASLGTIFSVAVGTTTAEEALVWLRTHSLAIYAARVSTGVACWDAPLSRGCAIVLGSESRGLSATWEAEDVRPIQLPMLGRADSLNVSVTAAVLFYEALRQRRNPDVSSD